MILNKFCVGLWFCLFMVLISCGDDDEVAIVPNVELSGEKEILSFAFKQSDNPSLSTNFFGLIDTDAKTISVTVPESTDVSALAPTIQVSDKATVSPSGAQDFSGPVVYTVKAEDNSTQQYSVIVVAHDLTQYEILQILYLANPDNTLTWATTDSDIGDWEGVTTDGDGWVTELMIPSASISVLPPEIGLLTELRILGLSSNQLTTLPEEIGSLVNLRYLDLTTNQQLTALPTSIGELVQLEELYAYSTAITAIPYEIGSLAELTRLDVAYNDITTLPHSIGQLGSLKTLRVTYNQLTALPPEIGNLFNLTSLQVSGNAIETIPNTLWQLSNLQILELQFNQLTSVSTEIANMTGLQSLNLADNLLTTVPEEIGELTALKVLNLRRNLFTTIPQKVCDLKNTGTNVLADAGVCN